MVVGSVLVVPPAGAALSDDDCETLIAGQSNTGQSSDNNNQENLAAQADAFSDTAADVSDKKVKAALLRLADVYDDASKAKTVAGSSLVLSERAKDYAKGYKVYAKSLNQCMVRGLSSIPGR